jgi:inositol-1,3,4-trisphosphate 5/6-kinase/inositol-tetrakisphosphate 1-kinase
MGDMVVNNMNEMNRPIVVGYAFGPKKMSTMGIVMAEASKTTTIVNMTPPRKVACQQQGKLVSVDHSEEDEDDDVGLGFHEEVRSNPLAAKHSTKNTKQQQPIRPTLDTDRVVFTIPGYNNNDPVLRANGCLDCSLVRFVGHNSTSSASTDSIESADMTIPVIFVPLDPEQPLEEQHGGNLDIILHKLTEDILCMSQVQNNNLSDCSPAEQAAMRRIRRLVQFRDNNPACCLVDDPEQVKTLMSRSEIALQLQECLHGVCSTSGMPVASPKHAVLVRPGSCLWRQTRSLTFPIIVKPLTAAGTKASHAMAVCMDATSLQRIVPPCLCQEFSNHDAILYKVYVLGDHVSVHQRPSLPNLPRDRISTKSYVEFDSQQPYPALQHFGFDIGRRKRQRERNESAAIVTADEVAPIVESLKRAFHLELFGFDVIISSEEERRKMLVVDVNYFPSYKEVPNFPGLLAKYLTNRALESRRKVMHPDAR